MRLELKNGGEKSRADISQHIYAKKKDLHRWGGEGGGNTIGI